MIDVIQMPTDIERVKAVTNSLALRTRSIKHSNVWIGQYPGTPNQLDEIDLDDACHIVRFDSKHVQGYARMTPVKFEESSNKISNKIYDVASQCGRLNAIELQHVCCDFSDDDQRSAESNKILRELIVEAFRFCNNAKIKFLFAACDKGGTEELKKLGMRYSTLSQPFWVDCRLIVIHCIAVTNSNFTAINPLKLVAGTELVIPQQPQEQAVPKHGTQVFEKLDALAHLIADADRNSEKKSDELH